MARGERHEFTTGHHGDSHLHLAAALPAQVQVSPRCAVLGMTFRIRPTTDHSPLTTFLEPRHQSTSTPAVF